MIDDVIDFTYSRNELWQRLVTREQIKKFFIDFSDTTLVVRREGRIIAVAVYIEIDNIITFISLTIDKDVNGFELINKFIANTKGEICWISKKGEIKKCHS